MTLTPEAHRVAGEASWLALACARTAKSEHPDGDLWLLGAMDGDGDFMESFVLEGNIALGEGCCVTIVRNRVVEGGGRRATRGGTSGDYEQWHREFF